MTTAERIRNRRESLGMTQSELAERMGLKGKSSISKIESSGNKVTKKTVEKVAAALDCRPSFLMEWDEETIRMELEEAGRKAEEEYLRLRPYADRIYSAYRAASPDTQAAVRAILHIEEE